MELDLNHSGMCYREEYFLPDKKHVVRSHFYPALDNPKYEEFKEPRMIGIQIKTMTTQEILRRNSNNQLDINFEEIQE